MNISLISFSVIAGGSVSLTFYTLALDSVSSVGVLASVGFSSSSICLSMLTVACLSRLVFA